MQFFLGRTTNDTDPQPVLYDAADLTTHAVLVGMTGSGKTGLLIALLEEAARQGLPAIIIDPKGDLTNLLLHFPELRPADFAPWIDPETARRQGVSIEQLAQSTAEKWRSGLESWGLGQADLEQLRDAVDYTIYTPGSTAGVPVNLLSSFAPPAGPADREAERERIASTVTALLGLIGVPDVDPLRSREHILLANIFEHAWRQGQPLDLAALIEQVQTPPFAQLGAFPLDRFFPEKDRFTLALLLNNFLAAPSFQTWLEGPPLDAGSLLYTPQGRPRFSIFYLAHLSENERMFFVTLLLAAVEGWMRAQRGTSNLRALLAFDEIAGYLPPVANPPSAGVLLRLLKQARAFGLGLALATQNPVDLNYKALSNAGTWFIGRLQTDQDRQRLLDGLQGLESGINRSDFERLIAALKPRMFLLNNVHERAQASPRIFQSRWALNYLAGPLARVQLAAFKPALPPAPDPAAARNGERRFESAAPAATSFSLPAEVEDLPPARDEQKVTAAPAAGDLASRPQIPHGFAEFFFPPRMNLQRALEVMGGALVGPLEPRGLVYKPALLAQAEARYLSRRYNLDAARLFASLVPAAAGRADWASYARPPFDPTALAAETAQPGARYQPLPAAWNSPRALASLQKDFLEWAYREATLYLRANEALKVYLLPEVSELDFRREVETAMRAGLQAELDKIAASYAPRLSALDVRIERQRRAVERKAEDAEDRESAKNMANFEMIARVFTQRKLRTGTADTRRRQARQARGALDEARQALQSLQEERKQLAQDQREAEERARQSWQDLAGQNSEIPVTPFKKDVFIDRFGIAWLPYHQLQGPNGLVEAPAF